jgi:hypothetical protein
VFDNRHSLDASLQQGSATLEQIYADPDDAWRLTRARRLAETPQQNDDAD